MRKIAATRPEILASTVRGGVGGSLTMLPGGVVWLINFSSDMSVVVKKSEVSRCIWTHARDETTRVVVLEDRNSGRHSLRVALAAVALLPKAFTGKLRRMEEPCGAAQKPCSFSAEVPNSVAIMHRFARHGSHKADTDLSCE